MKKKIQISKLSLKKETISALNNLQQRSIIGGGKPTCSVGGLLNVNSCDVSVHDKPSADANRVCDSKGC
jgi:hypothetical protein